MEAILGTYIQLIVKIIIFTIFIFIGIKIGITLRKNKNAKEGIE